ncbi:MAG: DotA/TraY family protein [Alphaproteobacteria bacterium]|nr:DotA/TraY family protein [Alphaproteobacteria bacterium]
MTIPGKRDKASDQPQKRSILGFLFNPHLGDSVRPMRENAQTFLQLLAMVFAIYHLIPKNYPGLHDDKARLSLFGILGTAWRRLEFTHEGAPRVILFFAIIGLMLFSVFLVATTLLSLAIGHAHAQTTGTSAFTVPDSTNDLAQNWINYLFFSGSYPTITSDAYGTATASMYDPFNGTTWLQTSFIAMLGYYSDAILIVAAFILFYHLTAMVVETAHHGTPMGKRASQIWAPIRLVVAIGLLVPINGGLSAGQYIVIQMAEYGSALASNTWNVFLTAMISGDQAKAVAPPGPLETKVAEDIIRMQACQIAWNSYVTSYNTGGMQLQQMATPSSGSAIMLGNISGTKYSFSDNSAGGQDICGWYFIPAAGNSNTLLQSAIDGQTTAVQTLFSGQGQQAAQEVCQVLPGSDGTLSGTVCNIPDPTTAGNSPTASITAYSSNFRGAIFTYQQAVNTAMASLTDTIGIADSAGTIEKYGWVMAGAFLNTITRVQAELSQAAHDSAILTSPPRIGYLFDPNASQSADDFRYKVADAMQNFDFYEGQAFINNTSNQDAQCAAGLGVGVAGGNEANGLDEFFNIIDSIAAQNGVWSSGSSCDGTASGTKTFAFGIQLGGASSKDPLAQMAALGQDNLKTAIDIASYYMGKETVTKSRAAHAMSIATHKGASAAMEPYRPYAGLIVLLFWMAGFTLAFILPLMPFMRFSFSVLGWFFMIIEAVIAVPLVALAHLNPEGEGLPGQAKKGYFFIFNLFLRPVLTVFGLICGLIMFLVAVSFINYAYAIAVVGAGGTASGMAAMGRLVYSILYVIILYICANHAFQLIDHLPENALKWMGAEAQTTAKMGDAAEVGQTVSGAMQTVSYQGSMAVDKNVAGRQLSKLRNEGTVSGAIKNDVGKSPQIPNLNTGSQQPAQLENKHGSSDGEESQDMQNGGHHLQAALDLDAYLTRHPESPESFETFKNNAMDGKHPDATATFEAIVGPERARDPEKAAEWLRKTYQQEYMKQQKQGNSSGVNPDGYYPGHPSPAGK